MRPVRCCLLAAGAAVALLLGACTGPAPAAAGADDDALTVFAAASLKEAMDEAATAYRDATGQPVRVSYAASSALARQIAQGAPADVFVPADAEWMDALQAQGLVDERTRIALLGNTLVLVAPATTATAAVELRAGVDLRPLLGQRGRIAMGLADSVPAGRYAKAAFTSLGVWETLAPHVAGAENVRAALMLVARGEAPLGVVYGSDARAEPRVRVLATFPPWTHPAIVYPAARVGTSRHPQAAAFVAWLQTPPAQAIFSRRGFGPR